MKFKYVIFVCCIFIILFCWGYIQHREKVDFNNEIKTIVSDLDALPLSYSIQDAIEDGYYIEDKVSDKTPDEIIKFLSYVYNHTNITFKIVSKEENELILTNIIYHNRKYTVIKYNINQTLEKRSYEKFQYNYLIVLTNLKNNNYSYYLTNDKELYESNSRNSSNEVDIGKKDVLYLFSRN